jgi:hypothetical protein
MIGAYVERRSSALVEQSIDLSGDGSPRCSRIEHLTAACSRSSASFIERAPCAVPVGLVRDPEASGL